MNHFVVIDTPTLGGLDDNALRFDISGITFNEPGLRHWAHNKFEVAENATLEEISTAIKADAWTMFQHIPPREEDNMRRRDTDDLKNLRKQLEKNLREQMEREPCPACKGSGKAPGGGKCEQCGGNGMLMGQKIKPIKPVA